MVTLVPFLVAKIPDDNDFLKLREMANVHENWTLDYDKNNIKIWSRVVQDASIKMVKVWAIFASVNSIDLYNTIMDPTYRKEWDSHMILAFDIGHLNPNNVVSYYAVSCPPPLRSRDFVLQTSWLDRGTEHFVLNHSVCHKDHPPKRGYIRAISYFTGYFIKHAPYNGCEMYFVSQTDPQGIIPAWVVNKCTQIFAPRFVKQLERAAFAYKVWKTQNNPDYIPWVHPEQITSPKILLSDCVPSEEEQQSPFFKYLAAKSVQIPEHSNSPIEYSSSPQHLPCTSGVSIKNSNLEEKEIANVSSKQSASESKKLAKAKKSKKTSVLDLLRHCTGKNCDT